MTAGRSRASSGQTAEIRDPIHGYIYATEAERKIIDTSTFQRLRRIRQLAGCHLVYPGGQHSRFEHVIGCMYLAGKVGEVIASKGIGFGEDEIQRLRLAALLHDIGHGPFSHMYEEVIADKTDFTHEDMTQKIIRQTEIGDILEKYGFSRKRISGLAIGKSSQEKRFMNDAIGGGLSVDIMDYLLRDSYFTGVEYGKVDVHRIINSFEIMKDKLAIANAALFAFEALMIARYEMFRAVYFHRTVRAAELMIIKAMTLADKALNLTDLNLDNFLSLTDEVTLNRITTLETGNDSELKLAKSLALNYQSRKLLKCVFEKTVQGRDKFLTSIFTQKSFRNQLSEAIAKKAGVPVSEVYVDVPTVPSVPVSSTRESFTGVTVVSRKENGALTSSEISVEQMPLISTISGFMDVMRVYTTEKSRARVQKATNSALQAEGYESKVSM
ncbi:MAG: HD domain-containing protein [Nitrososphaerota archaeon]|nr:HD domain-containing protein [Nitrososphaerota archaeon]MDG6922305.1 HD domain-containing protein [Nitrososphaerota archaeon]